MDIETIRAKPVLEVGRHYSVNIIGTGWILFKCGFSKYDYFQKKPCFINDYGSEVPECDYDDYVLTF